MTSLLPYVEESFGILTDDDLYLDCILVKPANMDDEDLSILRVWVPRYPLTKTSVITCARQEVKSYGPDGTIAHLVFDLRGTGDSEGVPGDQDFHKDLHAIADWADERFGQINFGFLGFPLSEESTVNVWPLRAGAVMESYYYPASGTTLAPPSLLYLSTYGNFSRTDDALCKALAGAGYEVYGLEPLRYLLHASVNDRLTPDDLHKDLQMLVQMLPSKPYVIGQPLAAGLAIIWASGVSSVQGLISIGRAQAGLSLSHIFQNSNPYTYLLHRRIPRIAPRPVVMVLQEGHPLGGSEKKLDALYQSSKAPHRLERTDEISPDFLLQQLDWMQEQNRVDEG